VSVGDTSMPGDFAVVGEPLDSGWACTGVSAHCLAAVLPVFGDRLRTDMLFAA
jgi:hypothetical protein